MGLLLVLVFDIHRIMKLSTQCNVECVYSINNKTVSLLFFLILCF